MALPRALSLALCAVLLALAGGWVQPDARAQVPCGDLGQDLPAGASLTPFACAEVPGADAYPGGSWTLQVSRVHLGPGESIAPELFESNEHALLYVERGTLTVFDDNLGQEATYAPGAQVLLAPFEGSTSYAVRNDGSDVLSFLEFHWTAPRPGTQGNAVAISGGSVSEFPDVGDSTPEHLADTTVAGDQLPDGPAHAFVGRLTLAPGASVGGQLFDGPVVQAVESGTLMVRQYGSGDPQSTTGAPMGAEHLVSASHDVTVEQGRYHVVPTRTPYDVQNIHGEPTSVLVIGLIPAETSVAANPPAAMAPEFAGSWHGTGHQNDPNAEWPMVVELVGGSTGVVGTIEYPSLGCQGEYLLEWVDGWVVGVTEDITAGDACIDGPATFELLGDGALRYDWWSPSGGSTTVTATLTRGDFDPAAQEHAQSSVADSGLPLSFAAADWTGGLYRADSGWYGRPWVAVYGAQSAHPSATLSFALDGAPAADATLTLFGLDDELNGNSTIVIAVNGVEVYRGASPFVSWDGVGQGENAAWTAVEIVVPATTLSPGANDITVWNLEPSSNVGAPPYVLLGDAELWT